MMRPDTFTRVRRGSQIADEPDIGPLIRLGPGGGFTRDIHGKDLRLSPLRGALSGFGRAVLRFLRRRR